MKFAPRLHRGTLPMLLGVAVLCGCASTGGLQSNAVSLAAASLHDAKSLAGVPTVAGAWPQAQWWQALGDTQLDALVAEALSANPDLAVADARARAAMAAAGVADARRMPTLSAGASAAGARVPAMLPPIATGHFGVIRYGYLSFKWDLDLWGGKRAEWQAAVGAARAATVDARAAQLMLASDVVRAYFDLAGAQTQRQLAGEELQRAQDFLALTRQRVANGIDGRYSLARIEAEVAGDRAHLEAAEFNVRSGGRVLSILLGAGPDRGLAVARASLPTLPALALPSDLPAELLGRRPDVLAARWRVEAASQGIQSARARFLPNLGISSLAGLIAPTATRFIAFENRFYTIQPAISLPLFEGGGLRANLAGKAAARDQAVAQYNRVLVHAINQVAGQVDALRSLALQAGDAEAARAGAHTAWQLAMQRYRAGVGSYLETLSVRQELLVAERELASLQARRADAWAALNLALGGGFQPDADAPSLVTGPATTSANPTASRLSR